MKNVPKVERAEKISKSNSIEVLKTEHDVYLLLDTNMDRQIDGSDESEVFFNSSSTNEYANIEGKKLI